MPSLETPQGTLTEVGAILEYIADTLVPALKPMDAWHAAKIREMMFYLGSTMHVNHAHKMRGHRWADRTESWEDMPAKVPETMAASCAYLEQQITGPYLFGAAPPLSDCYLYAISTWLAGDGVDVTAYPKLLAWRQVMETRPSVQKARADGFIGCRTRRSLAIVRVACLAILPQPLESSPQIVRCCNGFRQVHCDSLHLQRQRGELVKTLPDRRLGF